MHDRGPHDGQILPGGENISGTFGRANEEDSTESGGLGCVFIVAHRWPAGFPPFCGAPTLAHSPYCPPHAALCRAPAGEGER
jgi:hypothetical protein